MTRDILMCSTINRETAQAEDCVPNTCWAAPHNSQTSREILCVRILNLASIQEINTRAKSIYCSDFYASLNSNHRLKNPKKQEQLKINPINRRTLPSWYLSLLPIPSLSALEDKTPCSFLCSCSCIKP